MLTTPTLPWYEEQQLSNRCETHQLEAVVDKTHLKRFREVQILSQRDPGLSMRITYYVAQNTNNGYKYVPKDWFVG